MKTLEDWAQAVADELGVTRPDTTRGKNGAAPSGPQSQPRSRAVPCACSAHRKA